MLLAEFDWVLFSKLAIDGIVFGMFVALVALGYTMVYGIIGLINFAHGEVFMLGCFFSWAMIELVVKLLGWEAIPSSWHLLWLIPGLMLGSGVFCGSLNWAIDWAIYQPLRRAPKLAPLVSAIGVSFILQNVGLLWGGSQDFTVSEVVTQENLFPDSAPVNLSVRNGLILILVLPVMAGLWWLVHRTKLGKAMRAVQQNTTAAELMGIPVQRVIGATFAIGGALAGAASVVYALTNGLNNFQMGYKYGLYAFTAAVLGGIGSIPGTVLGSLVIGLVRAMTEGYLSAEWSNTLIFAILVVILVFRPSGLLGRTQREKV